MKNLGKFILIMAIITLCGMMNNFMSMKLNIMGLTERLVIYSLQILIFVLSFTIQDVINRKICNNLEFFDDMIY